MAAVLISLQPPSPPPTHVTQNMSFNAEINLSAWLLRDSLHFEILGSALMKCDTFHCIEFINGLNVISLLQPVIPIEINQLTFNI